MGIIAGWISESSHVFDTRPETWKETLYILTAHHNTDVFSFSCLSVDQWWNRGDEVKPTCRDVWFHRAAVCCVRRLTAPAGHKASVDLGPELLTYSVYLCWQEVRDGQQKYCAAKTSSNSRNSYFILFIWLLLFILHLVFVDVCSIKHF